MALFGIIALSILFGTHYFIYHSLVIIFGIKKYKIVLFLILLFLALSFIKATVLVHTYNNSVVRFNYYLTSVWLGIMSYLFLSFVFLGIIFLVFNLFHINLNLKLYGSLLVIFSFLISFYGIYNANNPKIKNVDITIKNLPETWKHKKIVFLADVHLGAIIREKFLEKITTMINAENPDMVLVSGDLFDGTDGEITHLSSYINSIKSPIYYVTGNHDTYIGLDNIETMLKETKIKVLNDEIINIDGVQLVGIHYLEERNGGKDLNGVLDKLKKDGFQKDKPSILLYHVPTYTKEFSDFGINLQLSGHTHKGQIWPYGYITSMIYGGKDFGLVTEGNYNIYTTNGVGTWGPPMRVGNTPEVVILNLK